MIRSTMLTVPVNLTAGHSVLNDREIPDFAEMFAVSRNQRNMVTQSGTSDPKVVAADELTCLAQSAGVHSVQQRCLAIDIQYLQGIQHPFELCTAGCAEALGKFPNGNNADKHYRCGMLRQKGVGRPLPP
jgi:hypothetical protein